MTIKNDVIRKKDIRKCRDNLRKDLSKAIAEIGSLSSSFLLDGSLQTMGWGDSFRALLLGFSNSEPAYRNLILNSAFHINSNCSLGVPLYLLTIEWLLKNNGSSLNELLELLPRPERVNSSMVISEWRKTVHDESTMMNEQLLLRAAREAGSFGTVVVEKTDTYSRIDIDCGSKFSCDVHPFFHSDSTKKIEFDNCIVVIVDGAIIEVSEIHHLLTYCYENKIPCILMASNFSDDVANTLRVNWEKNLVNILPLIISKELENINQVKDICQVANVLPVSKDTGMLVSNMDFKECTLNNITYLSEKGVLSISTTDRNFSSIRSLRDNITSKLEKEKVDDIREILKKRLSQLSTRKAIVRIKCQDDEIGMLRDRMGNLFQLLSCSGREGIVRLDSIFQHICVDPPSTMPTMLPSNVAEICLRRAISDVNAINKIMAIIKLDHHGKMEK